MWRTRLKSTSSASSVGSCPRHPPRHARPASQPVCPHTIPVPLARPSEPSSCPCGVRPRAAEQARARFCDLHPEEEALPARGVLEGVHARVGDGAAAPMLDPLDGGFSCRHDSQNNRVKPIGARGIFESLGKKSINKSNLIRPGTKMRSSGAPCSAANELRSIHSK